MASKLKISPSPKCAKCWSNIIDDWDEVLHCDEVTAKVHIDAATEVKLAEIATKAKDHQEVREQKEHCDLHKLEVEHEKLKMKMQLEMMHMKMQMSKGSQQMFTQDQPLLPLALTPLVILLPVFHSQAHHPLRDLHLTHHILFQTPWTPLTLL
jgi:hypothetical protein